MTRPTPQGRRVDSTDLTIPEDSRPHPVDAADKAKARRRMSEAASRTKRPRTRKQELADVLGALGLLPHQDKEWTKP